MSLSSVFVVCNALRLGYFLPPAIAARHQKETKNKKIQTQQEKENDEMFGFGKKAETVVLKVSGMMCGHCAARVEGALTALKGVKSAKVDLQAATVTVVSTQSAEVLAKAITDAGYTVEQ
jgi:copper chaperone CopZ